MLVTEYVVVRINAGVHPEREIIAQIVNYALLPIYLLA